MVAALLLLLHFFVPHEHHDELSDIEHEIEHNSADSLYDLIRLVFHQDLGDGHLEYFQLESSDLLPNLSYTLDHFFHSGLMSSRIEFLALPASKAQNHIFHTRQISNNDLAKNLSLRGPPLFS